MKFLDEYKGRKAAVVATLHGDVEIVTYTSNKGFFIITPANPHAYIGAGEYWPGWKTFVDRRRVALDHHSF